MAETPKTEEAATMTQEAEQFLREQLQAGRMLSRTLKQNARDEGISDKALRSAQEKLGIRVTREGFGTNMKSYWELPFVPSHPIRAHSCPTENRAQMGTNGAGDDSEVF